MNLYLIKNKLPWNQVHNVDKNQGKKTEQRFSLTELILVVAILAILISLLNPSLRKMVRRTRTITCKSHLSTIAQASFIYADNNKGLLPHNGNISDWVSYRGVEGYSGQLFCKALPDLYVQNSRGGTIMHCPEATEQVVPRWFWHYRGDFDYSPNGRLVNRFDGGGKEFLEPRITNLTSSMFLYVDAKFAQFNGLYYASYAASFSPTSDSSKYPWTMWPEFSGKAHDDDQANFAFGDGHVELIDKFELDDLTNTVEKRNVFLGGYK